MDKVKIADNMYSYYKQMLMLKRKILMHDGCFIKLEEADFESGDVGRILLSDSDIEKLCLLVKKSILRGNRILEQSGRDFHIIRNLLLKNRNELDERLRLFCQNDKYVGISSAFSNFAFVKKDSFLIGEFDFNKENDFSKVDSKCLFLENLFVKDFDSLDEVVDQEIVNQICSILYKQFNEGVYVNPFRKPYIETSPNILLRANEWESYDVGVYTFNDEMKKNLITFFKDVQVQNPSLLIPFKDKLVECGFYTKDYFNEQGLNDCLLAVDRYENLTDSELENFHEAVNYCVNKIINVLKDNKMNLKGHDLADYLFASKTNSSFSDEQLSIFKDYIEAMIKIGVLSHNYYDLSSDYTVNGIYSDAASYAGMNLINFPNISLVCGLYYVSDSHEEINFKKHRNK